MTAGAPTPLLEVRDVAKRFGGLAALDGCSLTLEAGHVTGLIGPNGAGKSTLLNVMTGLVRADQGSVLFEGRDVTALPAHRFPALGVARSFQIVRELGSLTVFENLLLAPRLQSGEGVLAAIFGRRKWWAQESANARKAKALLDRVGLFRLADHPSGGLSGGQKKLLDLARALLLEPKLILLDEPGAGVAPPLKLEMIRLIRELKAEGVSFGLVEHDMHLVGELCDRVHVMAEGKRLVSGTFEEVSRDRRVVEAYLGVAA
ncbi:ABC transporter ATP-binding protein [Methylopila henanensis]|uniref:ABC transporter ATP-binding protein n=1 Tax=Methylopila henanensis TaxID=873516 RepID=A0ABW4KCF8_9HYPH